MSGTPAGSDPTRCERVPSPVAGRSGAGRGEVSGMSSVGNGESAEDAFVHEVAEVARQRLGASVERAADFTLRITPAGSTQPVILHLTNIFAESRPMTDEARRGLIERAVLAMAVPPSPATWQEAAPLLMPAVRATSYHRPGPGKKTVLVEPLSAHLDISIAIDALYAMTFVGADDPEAWGVDWATIRAQAQSNLARNPLELEELDGALIVAGPAGYASSWLAVPAALSEISTHVGPETLAFVPSRDHLRFVDATDTEALLSSLERAMTDYQSDPRGISPVPYLVTDGRTAPWAPPPGHPAAGAVDLARLTLDANEYQYQVPFLEDRHGNGVGAANLTVARAPSGRLFSYAVWGADQSGLLPRVDYLILSGPAGSLGGALPWDAAIDIAGTYLVEEPDCRPSRWRHHGWPPPEILRQLQARLKPLGDL